MKQIQETIFGSMDDGRNVRQLVMENDKGLKVSVIEFGATLTSVFMPDRNGEIKNLILGYDDLTGYHNDNYFFGCTVGRYANRIARGTFELNGKRYTLARNNNQNHLHGGIVGFNKKIWEAETTTDANTSHVSFRYLSEDGEEGYPGNLQVKVIYSLNDNNELCIDYEAKTDQATPVNLTNHAYWNLKGAGEGTITNHFLRLFCSSIVAVNEEAIPTGEIKSVSGTPFDFTRIKQIGEDIGKVGLGFDHCFVIDDFSQNLKPAALLYDSDSGRTLEILTTKPGIQFYTGNFLDGVSGAKGMVFNKHDALCLETQYYPDAVNQSNFPSAILEPGKTYHHVTVHRFSIRESI